MRRLEMKNVSVFAAALLVALVMGCSNGSGYDAVNQGLPAIEPNNPGAGTGVGGLGTGPSPVELGAAANYVILAQSFRLPPSPEMWA